MKRVIWLQHGCRESTEPGEREPIATWGSISHVCNISWTRRIAQERGGGRFPDQNLPGACIGAIGAY